MNWSEILSVCVGIGFVIWLYVSVRFIYSLEKHESDVAGCKPGELCDPEDDFDMIERCKGCGRRC